MIPKCGVHSVYAFKWFNLYSCVRMRRSIYIQCALDSVEAMWTHFLLRINRNIRDNSKNSSNHRNFWLTNFRSFNFWETTVRRISSEKCVCVSIQTMCMCAWSNIMRSACICSNITEMVCFKWIRYFVNWTRSRMKTGSEECSSQFYKIPGNTHLIHCIIKKRVCNLATSWFWYVFILYFASNAYNFYVGQKVMQNSAKYRINRCNINKAQSQAKLNST